MLAADILLESCVESELCLLEVPNVRRWYCSVWVSSVRAFEISIVAVFSIQSDIHTVLDLISEHTSSAWHISYNATAHLIWHVLTVGSRRPVDRDEVFLQFHVNFTQNCLSPISQR